MCLTNIIKLWNITSILLWCEHSRDNDHTVVCWLLHTGCKTNLHAEKVTCVGEHWWLFPTCHHTQTQAAEKKHRRTLWLPVVHVRDCRRPVAKDPGLDVHGPGFWVSYCHIYYPLQAFTFVTCGVKRKYIFFLKCHLGIIHIMLQYETQKVDKNNILS